DELLRVAGGKPCEEALESRLRGRETGKGPFFARDSSVHVGKPARSEMAGLEFFGEVLIGGTKLLQVGMLGAQLAYFVAQAEQFGLRRCIEGGSLCGLGAGQGPVLVRQLFGLELYCAQGCIFNRDGADGLALPETRGEEN